MSLNLNTIFHLRLLVQTLNLLECVTYSGTYTVLFFTLFLAMLEKKRDLISVIEKRLMIHK